MPKARAQEVEDARHAVEARERAGVLRLRERAGAREELVVDRERVRHAHVPVPDEERRVVHDADGAVRTVCISVPVKSRTEEPEDAAPELGLDCVRAFRVEELLREPDGLDKDEVGNVLPEQAREVDVLSACVSGAFRRHTRGWRCPWRRHP